MADPARILIHLDHNPHPRVFDQIMSVDGGVGHVLAHGDVDPQDVPLLVSGTLYSRPLEELRHTAVLITGTNDHVIDEMVRQARRSFFGEYRVSLMSECKGGSAVAAAAVARIRGLVDLDDARASVIGGGPVGARIAGLLASAGADVLLSVFDEEEAHERRDFVERAFGESIEAVVWKSGEPVDSLLEGARVVVTAGPPGLSLLPRPAWESVAGLELLVDVSGAEPAGIEGLGGEEDGTSLPESNVLGLGGLAISRHKIAVHREAVSRLFGAEPIVLGPAEIAAIGREVVSAR
ncbi:MAG: methylene-tetrahydromethanopterin dehydrogenase N-terminal domain-containing protein [Gemmatimonadota bacterium]|nr:methylene-tetrahydromethanopterin dehydrogenase N-terminal domain-containing protein [Gemmatimonadota bacterium]